ncbi:hypothetical protein HRR83_006418 [Exophiala dermatitidis]|uniref:RING-type E3 ubiquitin transferase n=2 Tax=Exophiala dermatitidis TaxID=5970 RepID=H6CA95_EXODN|nr:E3 ubiquitin-protein ligase MARCH6 [Exophiala dermatitidis NIH/UT8656]KAJ4503661.1 hypothetical protein HRR75_008055 [Exophiala dermatitidis]EHY60059.1 E3 ubiquitin-protein ligase MARCH6 [Exophiala dermatitidis NIH/UT8656]KAJ4504519.1 hypothetical protein HRR73_008693 [Exophiala dermatitidis]KAJ4505395.1 hypothetical protein HRR74_008766 [Exophiala dermatitidis]KAJ4530616.1 hypothetical protein HRR76_008317 [Exophiala dermatitidis]
MPLDVYEKHPVALARERARKEAMDAAQDETQDYCRICRGEASPDQPLFYPCKCSGSIKFVHQECLLEWLSHSQKKYCELCKTSFRFTKIYDRSMPATLPFPLFLRQLARHAVRSISRWVRYLAVAVIWLCCLPWCIRQVWRGMFWLADGGWLNEEDVQAATQVASNVTSSWAAASSQGAITANVTVPEYLERIKLVFPPMQVSLGDIARLFFSQGLIGRLLQLVFSFFIPNLKRYAGVSDQSNTSVAYMVPTRPPSILSDIQILANWSSSPTLNNATVDVVEGQLICILLVTAFILVFLIREWVINQQLPGPDLAEVPPPAPVAEDNPQPIPGLVPRNDDNDDGDGMHAEVGDRRLVLHRGERPIAIPRPRRAITDDNILNVVNPEHGLPNLPARSQSLLSAQDSEIDHGEADTIGESSAAADDFEPRLSPRRSVNNSILVQRDFAVSPSGQDANMTFPRDSLELLRNDDEGTTHQDDVVQAEDSSNRLTSSQPDHAIVRDFETSSSSPSDTYSAGEVGAEGSTISSEEMRYLFDVPTGLPTGNGDMGRDSRALLTPHSSDLDHPHPTGEDQDSANNQPQDRQSPSTETSMLEKISDWLWRTDDFVEAHEHVDTATGRYAQGADGEVLDDELPEDPFPFVPDHHHGLFQAEGAAPVQGPVAEAREPNMFMGVDLNDPNAADDVEDLDGVLELLGMEGPVFGMIQNIIFSLFLITMTLTASVWCPYIWGKIALLLMSNPFGMLVKAPLYVLSKTADIVFDLVFFVGGFAGLVLSQPMKIIKAMSQPMLPSIGKVLNPAVIEAFSVDLSQKSYDRLERTLSGTVLNLKPDLPTFSMVSHQALRSFKLSFVHTGAWVLSSVLQVQKSLSNDSLSFSAILRSGANMLRSAPNWAASFFALSFHSLKDWRKDLFAAPTANADALDSSLVRWSTEDRILTVILGYAFFAAAGVLFLELAHIVLGLGPDEKVEGYFADCLRQAGGVLKVIVIIGIEMLVFPLYCGLLLDVALLPLFANATLTSRIAFMVRAPFTGIFIHWFIGTCYMFHFALFVSICRKIMRTGVLYFIRDPDDPNFHPVRDVLERPIPAQLGKIAFSALVYGGLVIVCLGGVVWSLDWVGGILPIQWATAEPKLAFPMDIVFYNFLLPFILRRIEPSKKMSAMFKWWFRACARGLRLTHFLFGEEREEEKYSSSNGHLRRLFGGKSATSPVRDGIYVRAPASDSVRIPKGRNVFLEVTEQNERVDGLPDSDLGIHGKRDDNFTKVYLPPRFRARIAVFIVLVWLFAAATGVTFTIGPLLLGRKVTQFLCQSTLPPNDLYAFTVGIHLFIVLGYAMAYARSIKDYLKHKVPEWLGPQLLSTIQYILGLAYLGLYTAVILPFVLSLIMELYIHVPVFDYLTTQHEQRTSVDGSSRPVATIFVVQSWTIGLLYLRLMMRYILHRTAPDGRVATALRAITRNGFLNPDVRLASRAFVLPSTMLCLALLGAPLVFAKVLIVVMGIEDPDTRLQLYRLAYPDVLGLMVLWLLAVGFKRQLANWKVKIRDEVYLIGERLHNFHEPSPHRTTRGKGKERAGNERPGSQRAL